MGVGGEREAAAEADKRAAAEAAAAEVVDGMLVGLGTGTTVAYLLPALARRELDLRCVATSRATEEKARALGLAVVPFEGLDHLDIAIDGADQVSATGWLIKGGGGAHTREKVAAAAADRFIVIVSADKLVDRLTPPVPLELLEFGIDATLRLIGTLGPAARRDARRSPDGGVIVDYTGSFDDPAALSESLDRIAGVVDHGLFPPSLVSDVFVGRHGRPERLPG
jgi:ribose 5-phosphate isomerase A